LQGLRALISAAEKGICGVQAGSSGKKYLKLKEELQL
jgi:hypothetical protein